jgi:hypothetical protein
MSEKRFHDAVKDGWTDVKRIVGSQPDATDAPLGDKQVREHITGEIDKMIERTGSVSKRSFPPL